MAIDADTFFREATLRICSTLHIEKAMQLCLAFLHQHMPADMMLLHIYDHGLGAMRTIARATLDGAERTDILTPLPAMARKPEVGPHLARVRMDNNPRQHPLNRAMVDYFGLSDSSLLLMVLETADARELGHLTLRAVGTDRYQQEHLDAFASLKEPFTIALSNSLQHARALELEQRLRDDKRFLSRELQSIAGDEIIGADAGLAEVMDLVHQVAPTPTPVLLLGETGVGKDIIAQAVHRFSSRREGPFIKVNCGAIPDTLIDSELFGHEKGAFSGAIRQKRGRFESAEGGTIFLDEVGELPHAAQVRLLRVLQSHEIERVGGTETIHVDIRVVAATNRRLKKMVADGLFREDLWFRISAFPISIPPLRERKQDLAPLVSHLLERKSRELRLTPPAELPLGTIDRLAAYDWPGNVRELQNVVERGLILAQGGPPDLGALVTSAPSSAPAIPAAATPAALPEETNLDAIIGWHIERVLAQTKGKVHGPGGAAELLGINSSTLRHRMRKLGVEFGHQRKR